LTILETRELKQKNDQIEDEFKVQWELYSNSNVEGYRQVIYKKCWDSLVSAKGWIIENGTKWDWIRHDDHYGHVDRILKINKLTGDAFWTGKHPRLNIVRDPPHFISKGGYNTRRD